MRYSVVEDTTYKYLAPLPPSTVGSSVELKTSSAGRMLPTTGKLASEIELKSEGNWRSTPGPSAYNCLLGAQISLVSLIDQKLIWAVTAWVATLTTIAAESVVVAALGLAIKMLPPSGENVGLDGKPFTGIEFRIVRVRGLTSYSTP